jgi:hypothetical protein
MRRGREASDEAKAAARYGLDDLLCLIAQRSPNLADALRQGVIGDRHIRPDGLDQLVLAHQPVGILDQIAKQLEGLGTELDLMAVGAQATGGEVQGESVETVYAAHSGVCTSLCGLSRIQNRDGFH